jgi:hypothetical protein
VKFISLDRARLLAELRQTADLIRADIDRFIQRVWSESLPLGSR